MKGSLSPVRRFAAGLALPACLSGCLQEGRGPEPLTGPSTLALSIRISASPDVLPADGRARADIAITATGPDGAPVGDLRLAVRIVEGTVAHDAGQLSARFVVTDSAGGAALSYRAPAPSRNPAGEVDRGRVVTLVVTPSTGDFANALGRKVHIRLVPAGAVIPPFDVQPGFEVTPRAPAVLDQVRFSAAPCASGDAPATGCTRDPTGLVNGYHWAFGDGERASGRQLAHVYSKPGTYLVRLTVTDAFNRSADATRTVTVAAGTPPVASFAVSPVPATVGARVFFDASASTASSGRRLVSHAWNFGDGATGTGAATSHVYQAAGTYAVVLNVTDDGGNVGSTTVAVEVARDVPAAVGSAGPGLRSIVQ